MRQIAWEKADEQCKQTNGNPKEKMLEIKSTVIIKDWLWWLICRLDSIWERIAELENTSIESSKTVKLKEKKAKRNSKTSKDCGKVTKGVAYVKATGVRISKGEKREKQTEKIFETIWLGISSNQYKTNYRFRKLREHQINFLKIYT